MQGVQIGHSIVRNVYDVKQEVSQESLRTPKTDIAIIEDVYFIEMVIIEPAIGTIIIIMDSNDMVVLLNFGRILG